MGRDLEKVLQENKKEIARLKGLLAEKGYNRQEDGENSVKSQLTLQIGKNTQLELEIEKLKKRNSNLEKDNIELIRRLSNKDESLKRK